MGLLGVLLGVFPLPLAHASCAGPLLGVGEAFDDAYAPVSGLLPAPDSGVIVSGTWFHTGCDDGGQGGCSWTSTQEPMLDVDLVLVQGDSSWVLGTVSASSRKDRYAITWEVEVPTDAQTGAATLHASGAELPVEISGSS